jgi:tRNA pseudouridine55 synthase
VARGDFHGLLILDKPRGITSRDGVNRALGWFPRGTRVGHTGTLDPLATGVLVVCIGVATRLTQYVQDMDKTYEAGLLLGARSDTDDIDGTVEPVSVDRPPDEESVTRALQSFIGAIEQIPPQFSAAKVTGRRAYALARKGEAVTLEARRVQVYGIKVQSYAYPRLQVEVRCGKGTYIRALARDLGMRLACGAIVETLRRTQVGPFQVANALSLDADARTAWAALLPLAGAVAQLPRVELSEGDERRLRQGQSIRFPGSAALGSSAECAVFGSRGELVAVARLRDEHWLVPAKVFSLSVE